MSKKKKKSKVYKVEFTEDDIDNLLDVVNMADAYIETAMLDPVNTLLSDSDMKALNKIERKLLSKIRGVQVLLNKMDNMIGELEVEADE